MAKLRVAFSNFANAPNTCRKIPLSNTGDLRVVSETAISETEILNLCELIHMILNVWNFLRIRISDFKFRPRALNRQNCILNSIRPAFGTMCFAVT